ncbi:MAG: hypothetical protein WBZ42_06435 [Halobacteriota archaeon]
MPNGVVRERAFVPVKAETATATAESEVEAIGKKSEITMSPAVEEQSSSDLS